MRNSLVILTLLVVALFALTVIVIAQDDALPGGGPPSDGPPSDAPPGDGPSLCTDGTWTCPDPNNAAREEWNWACGWYWGHYYAGMFAVHNFPVYCAQPIDTDQDGILDLYDACPFEGGEVDATGCPICEMSIDSDNDGVPDCNDVCPGFDDTIDVDGDRIPDDCDGLIDSDNDGVADVSDICPGFDDNSDGDSDNIPDGCDLCPTIPEGAGEGGCPYPATQCYGSVYSINYTGGRGASPAAIGVIGPFDAYSSNDCSGTPVDSRYLVLNEMQVGIAAIQCNNAGFNAWASGPVLYGLPNYIGVCFHF
jgi:hypothetical protein